ncbi:hypothetical protein PCANC_17526 [Puccinia coronata f. sp. avenae]|uniref:Uncharacterized protein n=1 Tax=Puccinia coronata f. sp. avenae TaxID=200324 RepID=A0A2N5SU17_9BASI|nr:hypothetical protein PCANC_17526 [Puccinia coronata f. sp. avenae]
MTPTHLSNKQVSYAGQPKKHSAAHQNCGNLCSKQKPNCQASSSFHPADSHFSSSMCRSPDSQPPLRRRDKGEQVTRGDSLPQPILGRLGGRT